jgi:hypothetical protein
LTADKRKEGAWKKTTKGKTKLKICCENEPFILRLVVSWEEHCVRYTTEGTTKDIFYCREELRCAV